MGGEGCASRLHKEFHLISNKLFKKYYTKQTIYNVMHSFASNVGFPLLNLMVFGFCHSFHHYSMQISLIWNKQHVAKAVVLVGLQNVDSALQPPQ